MIREYDLLTQATFAWPLRRWRRRSASDEDVIDPGRRLGAAGETDIRDIEVSGKHDDVVGTSKVLYEGTRALDLESRDVGAVVRVQVGDNESVCDANDLDDSTLASRVADARVSAVLGFQGRRYENSICLSHERRAEEALVQPSDRRADPARNEWAPGHDRECLHRAPALEARDPPHRKLLEADDIGFVATDELDHLLEESPAARRKRISVEDVPGTDDE